MKEQNNLSAGISRSAFLRGGLATGIIISLNPIREILAQAEAEPFGVGVVPSKDKAKPPKLFHNGLDYPDESQLRGYRVEDVRPMPVPYLEKIPSVIFISKGRQLFVDDFLIEQTTMKRQFHQPRKHGSPLMITSDKDGQCANRKVPATMSGGVWWDTKDKLYKMWHGSCLDYITSKDGIEWHDPGLKGVIGKGHISPWLGTASSTVLIDEEDHPSRRYKCYVRLGTNSIKRIFPELVMSEKFPKGGFRGTQVGCVLTSADGVHWSDPVPTSAVGDRTTMFYDPFRRKWVSSIREYRKRPMRRIRHYRSADDFLDVQWTPNEQTFWMRADEKDLPDPAIGDEPQLYNFDAVAYESVMLGLPQILLGPHNDICARGGFPKTTDLKLGFSRDGIHWDRPCRDAFIPSSRLSGVWDRGYVQSVGGICTVSDSELRFYYSGVMGDETAKTDKETDDSGMYKNRGLGFATLRRDGFASMDATAEGGSLTTRPLSFEGSFLFVNLDAPNGAMTVELLDKEGEVINGFSKELCEPLSVDATCVQVQWKGSPDLSAYQDKIVRFRFHLNSGRLYSFWVSPDKTGSSRGYLAAGCKNKNAYVDRSGEK